MRRSRRGVFLALPLLAGLAGCAVARADTIAPALPDLTSFDFVETDAGAHTPVAMSVDQAAAALKAYDVVFFGEQHDHVGNHLAEMQLLRALYERNPNLALSMEQFERDAQPVLDDYLAGRTGEAALRDKGRAWTNYREAYRPLVEFAKTHKLPVIAAEAPTDLVRCVGQKGLDFLSTLAPDKRAWAAAEIHDGPGAYRDKFFGFLSDDPAHGQGVKRSDAADPPPMALRSFAAQATRDDTMAESIFLFLQKHPGTKVLHVTGGFHVEEFLGTAERLKLRAPGLKLAVIDPEPVEDPEHPALKAEDVKGGTFALLLQASPDEYINDDERKAAEAQEMKHFHAQGTCEL